jgi:hypothetical protein
MKTLGNVTTFGFGDPAVLSGASFTIKTQIVRENGTPINLVDLNSLTLSIRDLKSGETINGISNVNILNTDRGAVDATGNLTLVLIPADTLSALPTTERLLVFNWVYGIDNRVGRHLIIFRIDKPSGDA